MSNNIFEQIKYHHDCIEALRGQKEAYFKDKSIPLVERFKNYCDYGRNNDCSDLFEFKNKAPRSYMYLKNYKYYSDFERYQEISILDIITRQNCDECYFYDLEDPVGAILKSDEEIAALSDEERLRYKELIDIIEELVSNNIGTVTIDW